MKIDHNALLREWRKTEIYRADQTAQLMLKKAEEVESPIEYFPNCFPTTFLRRKLRSSPAGPDNLPALFRKEEERLSSSINKQFQRPDGF